MAEYVPKLMQKKSFIRSKENLNVSYSWTDIASGLGYVDYIAVITGEGDLPFVTTSNFYSAVPHESKTADGNFTSRTFTLTFTQQRQNKGEVVVFVPHAGWRSTGPSSRTITFTDVLTIKKNNVQVGTKTPVLSLVIPGTGGFWSGVNSASIDIGDLGFGVGDTLTLTVASSVAGINGIMIATIGYDGGNRSILNATKDADTEIEMEYCSSQLRMLVPYRIEQ
jgi:hypothetical protein